MESLIKKSPISLCSSKNTHFPHSPLPRNAISASPDDNFIVCPSTVNKVIDLQLFLFNLNSRHPLFPVVVCTFQTLDCCL